MSNSIPSLLSDTLNLVTLARETALALGKNTQAEKLTPVVDELRTAVSTVKNSSSTSTDLTSTAATTDSSSSSNEIVSQSDFQALLSAAQNSTISERSIPTLEISERNSIVKAMADGNMPDVDIARQLGMTRDEVRLVLNIGKATSSGVEASK